MKDRISDWLRILLLYYAIVATIVAILNCTRERIVHWNRDAELAAEDCTLER